MYSIVMDKDEKIKEMEEHISNLEDRTTSNQRASQKIHSTSIVARNIMKSIKKHYKTKR